MRILLLGSDGTLGTALAVVFQDATLIMPSPSEVNFEKDESITVGVEQTAPNLVINAAAYTAVDDAERERDRAMRINGQAVGALADACAKRRVPLVHYSTDYVFAGNDQRGYNEQDIPAAGNAYGQSKLLGERLLVQSGAAFLLIRTSRLYGQSGEGSRTKKNFVTLMIEQARTRDQIEVVNDERASPTYALDLAQATRQLVDSGAGGIFHRTNDGSCTWYEFAREIFSEIGWRGKLVPVPGSRFPRPAPRPSSSVLLTTKLPPLRSWQAALKDYLKLINVSQ